MLHRALFLSQRGRRPPQSLLRLLLSSSSSSSSTRAAAAVAEQRPAGRGGGRHHHNHHNCRSISSTATRSQRPQEQDTQGQQSLVPPASWSIHDLRLLKVDAGEKGQQLQPAVSQEELGRLAGYAHVEVGPGSKLAGAQLEEDLGAIIRCMTLLQKADLEGVSREEMYAPPPHAAPATPLRNDVVTEGGPEQQRQLLALSGETARQQFVVPTVVDKGQA